MEKENSNIEMELYFKVNTPINSIMEKEKFSMLIKLLTKEGFLMEFTMEKASLIMWGALDM